MVIKSKTSFAEGASHAPNSRASRLVPFAVACALASLEAPVFAQDRGEVIEEVIVTATRRDESVLRVPYSISAYSAAALESSRVFDLASVARMVPGLSTTDQGPGSHLGQNEYVMRGLNTNNASGSFTNLRNAAAPVAVYVGETPMFFPINLQDIERVEVLRGPQGTLYGSGSLGGTIRFVPRRPDPEAFHAELDASTSWTDDAEDQSYDLGAVVNIPISDKAALRVVAAYKQLAGFIDGKGLVVRDRDGVPLPANLANPASGFVLQPTRKDVNDSTNWNVRTSFLFKPNDDWSVNFNYHHEELDLDSIQAQNPGWVGGPFDASNTVVPGIAYPNASGCRGGCYGPAGATVYPSAGRNENTFIILAPATNDLDLLSLDVEANLGFATLTSSTSYYEKSVKMEDYSNYDFFAQGSAPLASYYGYYPRLIPNNKNSVNEDGFIQEIRLVSSWDKPWDFVVGAYYQDVRRDQVNNQFFPGFRKFTTEFLGSPRPNPQYGDQSWNNNVNVSYSDAAIFGEITRHLSEKWQITGGIRAFRTEFENRNVQLIPFCGAGCSNSGTDPLGTISGGGESSGDDYVLKLNTSYQFSSAMMAYFNVAEGYRRGGANSIAPAGPFASLSKFESFDPDKAVNWELGLKGTLGERASYTVAGFFIDWKNPQVDTLSPSSLPYVVNLDAAQSKGLEIELNGLLGKRFSYRLGYSYTNAEITKDQVILDLPVGGLYSAQPTLAPVVNVKAGTRLPNVPEHGFAVAGEYRIPLNADRQLSLNVDGSYRSGIETTTIPSETYDGFWRVSASATLFSNAWSASLFVDNLTNDEGITGGLGPTLAAARSARAYVTRPRTIGLRLKYEID